MAKQYVRTEIRRQQIAEACLELIAERGLDGFTTRAVAQRVGITDGTIFRHFASKSEIVVAAMQILEQSMFDPAALEDCGPLPLQRLEALFRARSHFVTNGGALGRLVFSEQLIHAAGETGRDTIKGWKERNFALIAAELERLRSTGTIRHELDITAIPMLFHGLILTLAFERSTQGPIEPRALEERIASRWRLFCSLVLAGGADNTAPRI